jgi:hypothetical protein
LQGGLAEQYKMMLMLMKKIYLHLTGIPDWMLCLMMMMEEARERRGQMRQM